MRKFFFLLFLASLVLLEGCTTGADSARPTVFDAFHPGGPVYQPQEFVVEEPRPTEPPFGTYFEGTDQPAPPSFSDPYWITGYWGWKSKYWEWIPGQWVERPRPGLLWINASSITIGSHIYWKSGYWE
jgi:hypothetical protein